jgi:Ca2+-binding RTX toxin-like protein
MATVIGKNPAGEWINYDDGVTDYADTIVGNAGGDVIFAGGGADWIKGGGGADLLNGGAGIDTASYEDSNAAVTVSLASGSGQGGTAQGDVLSSIENLYGSSYDDTLLGNSGANTLSGGAGHDTLKGGGGADVLDGGLGNDWIEIDSASDTAMGGEGVDRLSMNTSVGMSVNLKSGMMDVNPYASPETYQSGGWHHGGGGGYYYYYGPFSTLGPYPQTPGNQPNASGFEDAQGSAYNDKIVGSDTANNLWGMDGNDILMGLAGNDVIIGGTGKDYIFAGTGVDTVTGGTSADRFIWKYLDESVVASGKPQDVITDFEQHVDKIDLSALDIALGDLLVKDSQAVNGSNYSYVGIDTNHNGGFDQGEFAIAVQMAPGARLNADDFLF